MDGRQDEESRHISVWINRSADEVYRIAADPENLRHWAAGLAQGEVTRIGNSLAVQSPMGPVTVEFVPPNDFGVLDHMVTAPGAESVYNPLRVLAGGADRCEVVFTLRRRGMSLANYQADQAAVAADLETLKSYLENG